MVIRTISEILEFQTYEIEFNKDDESVVKADLYENLLRYTQRQQSELERLHKALEKALPYVRGAAQASRQSVGNDPRATPIEYDLCIVNEALNSKPAGGSDADS